MNEKLAACKARMITALTNMAQEWEQGAVKPASAEPSNDAQDTDVSGSDSVLAFCLALSDEKHAVNPTDGEAPATMPETQ